jgi:hypothetical protein
MTTEYEQAWADPVTDEVKPAADAVVAEAAVKPAGAPVEAPIVTPDAHTGVLPDATGEPTPGSAAAQAAEYLAAHEELDKEAK